MFTGIVQSLGSLAATENSPAGKRLFIHLGSLTGPITPGDSICINGVCLTVVTHENHHATFDVITETLRKTTLGSRKPGDPLNLELSLRPDSFVGGHFVQGHIDTIATVTSLQQNPKDWRITFTLPPSSSEFMPCIVPKGSVAVDGVSMTIAETSADKFTLAVIPTTLERTTLGQLRTGDSVNVETDLLARTVIHYLRSLHESRTTNHESRPPHAPSPSAAPLTLEKLRELGFA